MLVWRDDEQDISGPAKEYTIAGLLLNDTLFIGIVYWYSKKSPFFA